MKTRFSRCLFVSLLALALLLCAVGTACAEKHPGLITITSGRSVGDGSYINCQSSGYPFQMTFTLDDDSMPEESCRLGVYNYDCDWTSTSETHEYDIVHVNGSFVGVLTGENNTWNTAYMDVPLTILKKGENTITVYVGHMDNTSGEIVQNSSKWLLTIKWASVQLDGGKSENAPDEFSIKLQYANRTANGIACGAHATIRSKEAHSYTVEYSLVDKTNNPATTGQIVASDRQYVNGSSVESSGHFYLSKDAPMGDYQIQVTLRDADTNKVYAYDSLTFDMRDALDGGCEHQKSGPAEYRRTEYHQLAQDDSQYSAKHQCIDLYVYTCKKCGKAVEEYRNQRLEDHTLPICVCGYVQPGYNPIHSAILEAVDACKPGGTFRVRVICDQRVASITAYNDVNFPLKNAWTSTANDDGTVTYERTYTASPDLESRDRYWTITAFNNNHQAIGTQKTNSLDILFSNNNNNIEEAYPTETDDNTGWFWFRKVKNFEENRNDTMTDHDDNRVSGRDEWQYMINFCKKLIDAGFDDDFIQDCYEELASCKNEQMRELVLMMFSADLIDMTRRTNNPDGSRWEGSSNTKVENGRIVIEYNGNRDSVKTIFHEIGHAIDIYAAMLQGNDEDGKYTVSETSVAQVKSDVENNVRATVTKVVNDTFKDKYFLFIMTSDESATRERYIEYLTYKVMNENVPFAESAEQKYNITLTNELQDAYSVILDLYRTPYDYDRAPLGLFGQKGDNLVNLYGDDAYCYVVSDVYGGVTNNNIVDGAGHWTSRNNKYDSSYYYWYLQNTTTDSNGNTVPGPFIQDENGNAIFINGHIGEIWAEYTESIITDVWYTDNIVTEFFPTFNVISYVDEMHRIIADSL